MKNIATAKRSAYLTTLKDLPMARLPRIANPGHLSIAFLMLGLQACGGGGSSEPADSSVPPAIDQPSADVPIDTSNNEEDNTPVVIRTIEPTDDIDSGGYVGGTGGVRDTVTIPTEPEAHQLGIAIRSRNFGTAVDARFGSFRNAQGFHEYVTAFNRPLDSCHRTDLHAIDNFGENLDPSYLGFGFTSPGEVLPLQSPSGSVGDLVKSVFVYTPETSDTALGMEPFELSISIPGDEFPAFQTATFPMVDPLIGFKPGNLAEGADTRGPLENFNPSRTPTLVWESTADSDTWLHLEFFADIPATPGEDDDYSVSVHCALQDDGEFTFPQQVIDLYPREPWNARLTMVARLGVKEIVGSDATLLLVTEQSY